MTKKVLACKNHANQQKYKWTYVRPELIYLKIDCVMGVINDKLNINKHASLDAISVCPLKQGTVTWPDT